MSLSSLPVYWQRYATYLKVISFLDEIPSHAFPTHLVNRTWRSLELKDVENGKLDLEIPIPCHSYSIIPGSLVDALMLDSPPTS